MPNPHDENFSRFENVHIGLLEDILLQLQTLNAKETKVMATLQEAADAIIAAVEKTKAAILSAVEDLRTPAPDTSAIADALSAAAGELSTAADDLSAADPTP